MRTTLLQNNCDCGLRTEAAVSLECFIQHPLQTVNAEDLGWKSALAFD